MGKGRGRSSIRRHSHHQKIKALPLASLFSFKRRVMQQRGLGVRKYDANFFQKWLGLAGWSEVRRWME